MVVLSYYIKHTTKLEKMPYTDTSQNDVKLQSKYAFKAVLKLSFTLQVNIKIF